MDHPEQRWTAVPSGADRTSPEAPEKPDEHVSTTTLQRVSWILICVLTYKPIGRSNYYDNHEINSFSSSAQCLRAARVLQGLASVLVIPLTSAAVSSAVVVSRQGNGGRASHKGPTLRQMLALADKGWMDPGILWRMFSENRWKQYGFSTLLPALALTILGGSIAPLQGVLMSYKTIRVPSIYGGSTARGFNMEDLTSWHFYGDRVTPTLQASLASTVLADPQPRLWSGGGLAGTPAKQISLKDMASTLDPFWAVLHAAFNTGARQGTALRANSTAKVSLIDKDNFPPNCADETSAMYFKHQQLHDQGDLRYTVEVCVPGDTVTRKLENRATRQDFTEELYIRSNITFPPQFGDRRKAGQVARKIKLSTTYGRFELPNFRNNQTASAIFNQDAINRVSSRPDSGKRDDLTDDQDDSCHGPLLYLALALFGPGPGSFPDTVSLRNSDIARQQTQYTVCVPFVGLVPDAEVFKIPILPNCVRFANETEDSRQARVDALRIDYLSLFLVPEPTTLEEAFNGAAFLVHEAISRSLFSSTSGKDPVKWDMGEDLEVPTISLAAMIVISTLLVLDIACLLSLAFYSSLKPQWTRRLDAFTMMRIGAALSEHFPLRVAYDLDQIKELDELPGWMGEALADGELEGEEDGGAQSHAGLSRWDREIELGGGGPLRNNVRYRCYNADHQVPGPMFIPETLVRRSQPPTTG